MRKKEFQEIGHCGGKVTFRVVTDPDGNRKYQIGWTHQSAGPAGLFAVYALPQGVAVAGITLGGIGTPWNPPPVEGCYPVMIASDSEGQFGHQCPACAGYWRSNAGPTMCPYCATRGDRHVFLTEAQQRYVAQYCARLNQALADENDGEHVIDMDAVAAAVGKEGEKPAFYYSEEGQQKEFNCDACGESNDITGKFAYCATCGTRNDLFELSNNTIPKLRAQINEGTMYDTYLSSAVSVFDTFAGQYAKQLVTRIPLRSGRKARIERMRFHGVEATATEFKAAFDIDILEGVRPEEIEFAAMKFHRRHVYEHNGGVVDEKYINDSGDKTVRLGQAIHETQASPHRLLGIIARMAENIHGGFHDIFPPESDPLRRYQHRKKAAKGAL